MLTKDEELSRVEFFVWLAVLVMILVDNLRKRTVVIMYWCCMCKRGGESIHHLLPHFEVVRIYGHQYCTHLGWNGSCLNWWWI